jgi:hypothetical protein
MNKISLRNGDWSFIPTNEKIIGETIKHDGTFTFAEGEATGHFHKLMVKNKDDMTFKKMPDGSYLVVLKSEGIATHPEHSLKRHLTIPPGTYKLTQRREKDWFQLITRKVLD